jgi:hypothetical protein
VGVEFTLTHEGNVSEVQDRTINLGCAVASVLWGATALLLAVSWEHRDVYLATWACPVAAAAATATVRNYFVVTNQLMRNAFACGVDVGRREPTVPVQRIH